VPWRCPGRGASALWPRLQPSLVGEHHSGRPIKEGSSPPRRGIESCCRRSSTAARSIGGAQSGVDGVVWPRPRGGRSSHRLSLQWRDSGVAASSRNGPVAAPGTLESEVPLQHRHHDPGRAGARRCDRTIQQIAVGWMPARSSSHRCAQQEGAAGVGGSACR